MLACLQIACSHVHWLVRYSRLLVSVAACACLCACLLFPGPFQSLAYAPWPQYDETLCSDAGALATVAVQLNGKTLKKLTLELPQDADEAEARAAALALPGVARRLDGRAVKRLIYVPGRIVNIIA